MPPTRLETAPHTDIRHFIDEQFEKAGVGFADADAAKLNQVDAFVRAIPKIAVGTDGDRVEQVLEEASDVGGVPGKLAHTRKSMTRVFDSLAALSFELGGHGSEHELNDGRPVQDVLAGAFGG